MPRALTSVIAMMKNDSEQHLGGKAFRQRVEAEEAEQVDRSDLGDVGQHDNCRDSEPPAADPADPRARKPLWPK